MQATPTSQRPISYHCVEPRPALHLFFPANLLHSNVHHNTDEKICRYFDLSRKMNWKVSELKYPISDSSTWVSTRSSGCRSQYVLPLVLLNVPDFITVHTSDLSAFMGRCKRDIFSFSLMKIKDLFWEYKDVSCLILYRLLTASPPWCT